MQENKIMNIDKILLVGIILAPMTGLRILKVGPSELLVLLWCILNIKQIFTLKLKNYNFLFWFFFIFSIVIGLVYGLTFHPNQVIISQIFTWIYLMAISLGIYQGLQTRRIDYLKNFFNKTLIFAILFNLFLYLYSIIVSPNFFGAPLWYGEMRYSGGGTNPHQVALLFGVSIPFFMGQILKNKKIKNKFLYIILLTMGIGLGLATASSTLVISVFVAILYIVISWSFSYIPNNSINYLLIFVISSIIMILFTLGGNYITEIVVDWVSSDPNGMGRFEIFSSFPDTIKKSYFIGLGPGIHAEYGTAEYHNTYLEIISMSGIIGFIIFLIYTFKIFKVVNRNIIFQSIIISMYVYGMAGFSMRRLIYWSILMIMLVISEKENNIASINFSINKDN